MARTARPKFELTERALSRWQLVQDFQARLHQAAQRLALHPTWADPQRGLQYADCLSLFLLGLLNPVARTMRGLPNSPPPTG